MSIGINSLLKIKLGKLINELPKTQSTTQNLTLKMPKSRLQERSILATRASSHRDVHSNIKIPKSNQNIQLKHVRKSPFIKIASSNYNNDRT